MSTITKRNLIAALIALGAAPAFAQTPNDPFAAGAEIGLSYLAANPNADLSDLAPGGLTDAALSTLRTRIAEDFSARRTFVYRGWILSETEARLFALLSAA